MSPATSARMSSLISMSCPASELHTHLQVKHFSNLIQHLNFYIHAANQVGRYMQGKNLTTYQHISQSRKERQLTFITINIGISKTSLFTVQQ